MDRPISNFLRTTFLVHMIFMAVAGAALWLVPGTALTVVGWVPETRRVPGTDLTAPGTIFVDPILTRVLGAALLGFAYSSFRGWRARNWNEVASLVQLDAIFSLLAVGGFLAAAVLGRRAPVAAWVVGVVIFAGFLVAWGLALRRPSGASRA